MTFCVLDAVWSIGAHYDRVVVPVVRGVAAAADVAAPTAEPGAAPDEDTYPLERFLADYPDADTLAGATNRQRTSTRGGVLKAEAALRYATILRSHGITTGADAASVVGDTDRLVAIDEQLARVPGDGVRRAYFWMLVGDDHQVKPDRMVLRFLARHDGPTDVAGARTVLAELAAELTEGSRVVTPWMVDHAIWLAERGRR
ncbi:hypothetical protein CHMI_01446 [Cellulomonas hominis]|nr:hypothetical protein CHMI_01446 [Cellulomonas hominis]